MLFATTFGFTAVLLGAFGAHGLKNIISLNQVVVWQKGVEYQFYHAFALLFLSLISGISSQFKMYAFYFFCLGIVLFSGSLYILSINSYLKIPFLVFIGPITPIGGLLLMLGWFCVFWGILKFKR